MPFSDRDYVRGQHPPSCTCVDCTEKRLKRLKKEAHPNYVSYCPKCRQKSLWYNVKEQKYECLNLKCKITGSSPNEIETKYGDNKANINKTTTIIKAPISKWLKALLLIFTLSLIGLVISILVENFIPLWILFGFSCIFSVEKYFNYYTMKYKSLGKLYRLVLNLCILSVLGLIIWSGIELFSQKLNLSALTGSLIFLAEIVLFIWLWKIVLKNNWRWPSMKLTITCVVVLFVVFAFAGVEPMSTYKNRALEFFSSSYSQITEYIQSDKSTLSQSTTTKATSTASTLTGIEFKTGIYKDYFLGLVKTPDGVVSGSGCYGEFIVLINNKNVKDPTYAELLAFLESDNTDEYGYVRTPYSASLYFGSAESKIQLHWIQGIINRTQGPLAPKICADFAERLHNNAERAGIRCGYVIIDSLNHAINVFNTTDKGLIYIDDTGNSGYGPSNCDKIVDVQIGKHYIPISLFPEVGWNSTYNDMGVVEDIFITWDGEWN